MSEATSLVASAESLEHSGLEPELILESVQVTYGRVFIAIEGISITVPKGQMVGLLGSNGAGKTTTLRSVTGFLRSERAKVTAGRIRYRGQDLVGRAPHWVARRGLVLVPERDKVFAGLSVKENLEIGEAGGRGARLERTGQLDMIYDYFPILADRGSQKAGYLSGGERQMLGLARALMRRPSMLMIDELSLGLAPKIVDDLMRILRRINTEQETTVLFVEQNAHAAMEIADYVYVMESGRLALEGAPEELQARSDVQELYLGMGEQEIRSYGDALAHRKETRWWG